MPEYAIKIGEIMLRSPKPITDEERKRAVRQLLKRGNDAALHVGEGLEVVLRLS